jgi:hypothetical protein
MPPTRRTPKTATREDGSPLYSETKADGTPVFSDRVTVSPAPGVVKTYPDMTKEWAEFIASTGMSGAELQSAWAFMRNTTVTFMRDRRLTEVRGWCHLDDLPVAYFVRAYPTLGRVRDPRRRPARRDP